MIFDTVREIVAEQFVVEEDFVTMETSFVDDFNADSLDLVELAMQIEEKFEIPEIDNGEMEKLQTVGDVVRYITKITEE